MASKQELTEAEKETNKETWKHINRVDQLIRECVLNIMWRAAGSINSVTSEERELDDRLWAYVCRVRQLLNEGVKDMEHRAEIHDQSKLRHPEVQIFTEFTPKLKGCTYGSNEYRGYLMKMDVALKHHYDHNSHHPEHYDDGIGGMNLFDLLEMLMDWMAATERHDDGDIRKSLKINTKRFGIDRQLVNILSNTIEYLEARRSSI